MARSTKPPSAVRVKLAVHMRRCGSTWRAVGVEVGCSPETVRQWPRIYPQEWQSAVRDDAARTAGRAEGEVIGALRQWAEIDAIKAEKTRAAWRESVLAMLMERSHDELKSLGELCLQLADKKRKSPQPVWPRSI